MTGVLSNAHPIIQLASAFLTGFVPGGPEKALGNFLRANRGKMTTRQFQWLKFLNGCWSAMVCVTAMFAFFGKFQPVSMIGFFVAYAVVGDDDFISREGPRIKSALGRLADSFRARRKVTA